MVVVSEQCDRGRELTYVVLYGSSSGPVANVTISPANCSNSECRHTLDVSCMRPVNYTVSVAAVNVVGGDRSTESRTISEHNVIEDTVESFKWIKGVTCLSVYQFFSVIGVNFSKWTVGIKSLWLHNERTTHTSIKQQLASSVMGDASVSLGEFCCKGEPKKHPSVWEQVGVVACQQMFCQCLTSILAKVIEYDRESENPVGWLAIACSCYCTELAKQLDTTEQPSHIRTWLKRILFCGLKHMFLLLEISFFVARGTLLIMWLYHRP